MDRLCAGLAGCASTVGLVLAGVLVVSAGASWGQSTPSGGQTIGKPIQLAPPSLFAPAQETPAGSPAGSGTGDAGGGVSGLGGSSVGKSGIEVDRLGEVAPEAIGVLDGAKGGLGETLWQGSDRTSIEGLLRRLPASYGSPTLRDLARRVLLSNAATPLSRSEGPEADDGTSSGAMAALRVERLAALGDAEGVAALTRVMPQSLFDESIARARVDSLFVVEETDLACREARNGASAYPGQAYWTKALVFCQIVEGKADQAALGLALLREQVGDSEPAFFALVEAISGVDVDLPDSAAATPLLATMLRFSGKKAPSGLPERVPAPLQPVIAKMANLSLTDRAEAAERAVAGGALDPEVLREVYGAFSFSEEDFEKVLEVAPALEGPVGRALLYQAARAESLPGTLAEILDVALSAARGSGHYLSQARVLEPLLATVSPQREMVWFAETAARVFFVTGAYERASAWVEVARSQVAAEPKTAAILTRLSPYSRLSGFRAAGPGESLADWIAVQDRNEADGTAGELLVLRASLQALGIEDSLQWTELAGIDGIDLGDPLLQVPLLYAAQTAAAAGRRGEAVLAALVAVGDQEPARVHPVALGAVLGALRAVGLEDEARAIAVETAFARGL